MPIRNYSKTAASNTTIEGFAMGEGVTERSSLNDLERAQADMLRSYYDDVGGQLTTGGTATAYTLTTNQVFSTDPADGDHVSFVANASNTAAATLNVDTRGAKAIRKISGATDIALAPGDIQNNGHYSVRYDASANAAAGAWILLNPAPAELVISSGTVTAAATLDITGLTTAFRAYKLVFDNLAPATDAVDLYLRTDTNGGASFEAGASDYSWSYLRNTVGTTADASGDNADSRIYIGGPAEWGTGAEEKVSGEITIFNPASASVHTRITYFISGCNSSGNVIIVTGVGSRRTAEANDAIRLMFSSGNIATMNYTLYGLRA